MPDVSGTYIRGLLLAQPIEPWVAQSAYTERSPVADLVAKGRSTYGVLVAAGVPDGTASLQVRCQHGGTPGQIDPGPTVAARRLGETYYHGWEAGIISGWEPLTYTSAAQEVEPTACTAYDDTVVVMARRGATLLAWRRNPNTGAWTGPVTAYSGTEEVYWPCLLAIEEEVYCIVWRRGRWDLGAVSPFYLTVLRESADGTSWEIVQEYANVEDDTYGGVNPVAATGYIYGHKIAAAYKDGQVIVLAGLDTDVAAGETNSVRQWAGSSLLERLDHIDTFTVNATCTSLPAVVALPSEGFLIGVLNRTYAFTLGIVGSAHQPASTAAFSTVGSGSGSDTHQLVGAVYSRLADISMSMAMCDGFAQMLLTGMGAGTYDDFQATASYMTANDWLTQNVVHVSSTFTGIALQAQGQWYRSDDDGGAGHGAQQNYPINYAATWQRGRLLVAHTWVAPVAAYDNSVAVAYLGGWTDLPTPWHQYGVEMGHRAGYNRTWLPFERPDDQDFTTVTVAPSSSTLTVDVGENYIVSGDGAGAAGGHYFNWSGAGIVGPQNAIVEWENRVVQGGDLATTEIGVRVRLACAGVGVEIEINQTTTGFRVIDYQSGATLATIGGLSDVYHAFRLGMYLVGDTGAGRNAQLWYRVADQNEERRWIRVGAWVLGDDAGVGGVVPHVEWGNIVTSGSVTQNLSGWRRVQWTLPETSAGVEAGTYAHWYSLDQAGGDNPGKLPGKPLTSNLAWATGDFVIAGRSGPFLVGDTFVAAVTGEFALSQATSLEAPTPRWYWEATNDTAAVTIAWPSDPDQPGTEDNAHPPVMGLYLGGINFRRALLYSRTAAGADTLRATIDTRVLSGVGYARKGRRIEPSGAASTVYMTTDEAAGYTAEWDDGAGTTVRRKVAGNDAGRWNSAAADPVLRIELESTTAADPTSGGTFSLWSSDVLVVLQGRDCAGWKLVIDNTYPTADGQYRIGSLLWGPMHVFGLDYAWGRSIELEAGHEYQTVEGKAPIRIDRGPATRLVRIAWEDGVDETEIRETSATNWVSAEAGADPAASRAATLHNLQGALRRHAGRPVVLATSIVRATGLPQILKRHDQRMLATIPGGLVLETMLGDENATEVARGGTLELVEVR